MKKAKKVKKTKPEIEIELQEIPKGLKYFRKLKGHDIQFTNTDVTIGWSMEKNAFLNFIFEKKAEPILVGKLNLELIQKCIELNPDETKIEIYVDKNSLKLMPCKIGNYSIATIHENK